MLAVDLRVLDQLRRSVVGNVVARRKMIANKDLPETFTSRAPWRIFVSALV